jgi:flagellin-like protein
MKRIWKNKEGVSPVIATILMVAITVVLAAVLYVMVSGYMTGGGGSPVAGSLTYLTANSNPSSGNAVFTLALTTPANPPLSDVTVNILDASGNAVTTSISANWTHLTSDPTHIKGGDRLVIDEWADFDISGYEIIISIAGYSGTLTGNVPE